MEDKKVAGYRAVLKQLIAMAQEAMMDGMGDDEETGDKIKEAVVEGAGEESGEAEASEGGEAEGEETSPDQLRDYMREEMKKGKRSPLKDGRQVAMVVGVGGGRQPRAGNSRGKFA